MIRSDSGLPAIAVCSLVFLTASAGVCAASEDRTVHLTITVKRANGDPVPDAPLCARSRGAQSGAATDQQGTAVIDVTAAPDEDKIAVQIAAGCDPFHGSLRRFREITDSTAVQSVYWLDVPAGATRANLTISLGEPEYVTGRLVEEDGTPVKASGGVRGSPSVSIWKTDGRFRLPVRVGTPSELFFVASGHRVKVLPIGPLNENKDLGDVQMIQPVQGDASVRVTLTDANKVDHRLENKGAAVSLISSDGASVFTYVVKDRLAVANYATDELPKVPAGTYYVTSGLFGNSLSFKVLDAVRNGVDLKATGVPRIEAIAGRETVLNVNVPRAEAAINALGAPQQGR